MWHTYQTHLSEQPKPHNTNTAMSGKHVEQQELSFPADRMWNVAATLEDILLVSHKAEHTLTIWFSSQASQYLSEGGENFYQHRNLSLMFIAATFKITKTYKQLRYPSVGEWTKQW
jgi:hypothetical protein